MTISSIYSSSTILVFTASSSLRRSFSNRFGSLLSRFSSSFFTFISVATYSFLISSKSFLSLFVTIRLLILSSLYEWILASDPFMIWPNFASVISRSVPPDFWSSSGSEGSSFTSIASLSKHRFWHMRLASCVRWPRWQWSHLWVYIFYFASSSSYLLCFLSLWSLRAYCLLKDSPQASHLYIRPSLSYSFDICCSSHSLRCFSLMCLLRSPLLMNELAQ